MAQSLLPSRQYEKEKANENRIAFPPKLRTDAPAPPQRLKACPPAADAVIVIVVTVGKVQLQAEAQ
jgi:hypothetical protein